MLTLKNVQAVTEQAQPEELPGVPRVHGADLVAGGNAPSEP